MKHYLLLFLLIAKICSAQYFAHYTLKDNVKKNILYDRATVTTFSLDSNHIFITARDKTGKELWRTDPWKDNKLMTYRVNRPVIVYFYFENSSRTNNKEVIWIVYNNTQFGFIEKETGRFTWMGQD